MTTIARKAAEEILNSAYTVVEATITIQRAIDASHEELVKAVRNYINERDAPVPDPALRMMHLTKLRRLTAPPKGDAT